MAEKVEKTTQLAEVNAKKSLISSAGEKISAGESAKIVKEYLPEVKVEERIISNISYLASDSNVSLLDISLADGVKKVEAGVVAPVEIDPATGLPVIAPQTGIQSTTAKISVAGSYQQIRIFLDGIESLPLCNVIDSASIKTKEAEKKADGAEASNPDSLIVDMDVSFGYMAVSKITGVTASTFNANIDEPTVTALKGYFSSKNQVATSSAGFVGEKGGRTNPFLAN